MSIAKEISFFLSHVHFNCIWITSTHQQPKYVCLIDLLSLSTLHFKPEEELAAAFKISQKSTQYKIQTTHIMLLQNLYVNLIQHDLYGTHVNRIEICPAQNRTYLELSVSRRRVEPTTFRRHEHTWSPLIKLAIDSSMGPKQSRRN